MDASNASHCTGLRPDKSIRGSGQSSASPRGFESEDSNLSKLTECFAAMQLTETRRESQAGYANPPSNQTKHFRGSEGVRLELASICPGVGNTLGGCASNWHLFARRWQHTQGLRLELASIRPGVGNTLRGCASNWHPSVPALATRSGAAPRIGIHPSRRWQHARGLRLELASIRPALATRSGASPRIGIYSPGVGNTLGGFASH
jgi:hypothetical protein